MKFHLHHMPNAVFVLACLFAIVMFVIVPVLWP